MPRSWASTVIVAISGGFWREIRLLAVALLIGFVAMVVTGVAYAVVFARPPSTMQGALKNAASIQLTVLTVAAYGAMAAFILWRLPATTGLSLRALGLRGLRARDWTTIGAGLVAILAANAAFRFIMVATGNANHQQAGFEHAHVGSTIAGVLFLASTVVLAPFTEELVFRLVLFRALAEKMPWLVAAGLTAVVFGAAHGDLLVFPVLAWLGFVNAVAYRRSGNIVTSMVLHGVNNLVAATALL